MILDWALNQEGKGDVAGADGRIGMGFLVWMGELYPSACHAGDDHTVVMQESVFV